MHVQQTGALDAKSPRSVYAAFRPDASLCRLLLTYIVLTTDDDDSDMPSLVSFAKTSALCLVLGDEELRDMVSEAVKTLRKLGMVVKAKRGRHDATKLGRACVFSFRSVDEAKTIFNALGTIRASGVVLSGGGIHPMFLSVPPSIYDDERMFRRCVGGSSAVLAKVKRHLSAMSAGGGAAFGLLAGAGEHDQHEWFDRRAWQVGRGGRLSSRERRCVVALILAEHASESGAKTLARSLGVSGGKLETLAFDSARHAAMLSTFSRELGWGALEHLLKLFARRLFKACREDITDCDLLDLMGIAAHRARILVESGIKSVIDLHNAGVGKLAKILKRSCAGGMRSQTLAAKLKRQARKEILRRSRELAIVGQ